MIVKKLSTIHLRDPKHPYQDGYNESIDSVWDDPEKDIKHRVVGSVNAYLIPAIKWNGKVYKGDLGEDHYSAINKIRGDGAEYNDHEARNKFVKEAGLDSYWFVNDKGQILDRKRSYDYAQKEDLLIDGMKMLRGFPDLSLCAEQLKSFEKKHGAVLQPWSTILASTKVIQDRWNQDVHIISNPTKTAGKVEKIRGAKVYKNPVKTQLDTFLREAKGSETYGDRSTVRFLKLGENIYIWDGYITTHGDVIHGLFLTGQSVGAELLTSEFEKFKDAGLKGLYSKARDHYSQVYNLHEDNSLHWSSRTVVGNFIASLKKVGSHDGVLTNPSYDQLAGQLKKSIGQELRYIIYTGNDKVEIFTVDSTNTTHSVLADKVGIPNETSMSSRRGFIMADELPDIKRMGLLGFFKRRYPSFKLEGDTRVTKRMSKVKMADPIMSPHNHDSNPDHGAFPHRAEEEGTTAGEGNNFLTPTEQRPGGIDTPNHKMRMLGDPDISGDPDMTLDLNKRDPDMKMSNYELDDGGVIAFLSTNHRVAKAGQQELMNEYLSLRAEITHVEKKLRKEGGPNDSPWDLRDTKRGGRHQKLMKRLTEVSDKLQKDYKIPRWQLQDMVSIRNLAAVEVEKNEDDC